MMEERRLTSRPAPAWARLALGPALALALAAGARADDPSSLSAPTTSLDEVERGQPSELGEVERQSPAALEGGGRTEELRGFGNAGSSSVEGVNRAAQPWQPPACDLTLPPGVDLPEEDDPDLWRARLAQAEEDLERARTNLRRAELGFTEVNTDPGEDAEVPAASDALQQARAEYAAARCAVPALLEAARRAGIPPGTLRQVRDDVSPELYPEETRY